MGNPFKQDMVRMKAPENCGPNISVGGFAVDVEDGHVEVPPQHVEQLEAHGFARATTAKPVEPQRKK